LFDDRRRHRAADAANQRAGANHNRGGRHAKGPALARRSNHLAGVRVAAWGVAGQVAEDTVVARADEPNKIKARPTFHYRLPDSRVDDPKWSFACEWNRWVEVERLAENPDHLRALSDETLRREGSGLSGAALREFAARWGLEAP
jgi:hypothetical protein